MWRQNIPKTGGRRGLICGRQTPVISSNGLRRGTVQHWRHGRVLVFSPQLFSLKKILGIMIDFIAFP